MTTDLKKMVDGVALGIKGLDILEAALNEISARANFSDINGLDSRTVHAAIRVVTDDETGRAAAYEAWSNVKHDAAELYDTGHIFNSYLSDVLDIRQNGHRGICSDSWTVTSVEFCVTLGGPNIWVESTGTGRFTIKGYWASEYATAEAYSNGLSDYLEEYAGY